MQIFKTVLVLMLFAFSSTSMLAQDRTEFYPFCVDDRPEGLTEEQALALFPNVECEGTLSVEKIEDLQYNGCDWATTYEYILYCDGEQIAIEKLSYQGGDTEAPKLEVPADVTVECDAVPELGTPTATDNCAEDVNITFDGEIRIDGDCDYSYTLLRTWTATDSCNLTHTLTQTITVQDTKGPELRKGAKVPTGETGMNVCYKDIPEGPSEQDIADLFSDNCGEVMVIKERVFKGTDCLWKGYINYYITDDCGNAGDTITLYYNGADNEAPVFVDAPGEITVTCIDLIPANYVLAWTDNCSVSDPKSKGLGVDDTDKLGEACEGGYLIRTWTAQDACGNEVTHSQKINVEPAPAVTFDEAEEVIDIKCEELESFVAGTLGYSNGGDGACNINGTVQGVAEEFTDNCGSFTVTYTYEDTCNSLVFVQTINVIDDVKPTLTIPANDTVECDSVPGIGEASATDNCDTDVDVKFDGEVRTDGDCADSYTLTRTWTATDNCGNSTTLSQTIIVQDTTKPEITVPADVTAECDNVPSAEDAIVTATDNCDVEVEIAFVEDKIEMGDDDCDNTYVIYRIWRATDNCDNTVLGTQKITVVDTTAPVLTVPGELTVECDAVPGAPAQGDATATDNCDLNVYVVYNGEERTDGTCEDTYTLTRSWTATDCAGNSTTETQTINVQDTTNPTIVVPVDVTVECDMVPSLEEAVVTASDNCDKEVSIRFVDEKRTDGACADSYTLERTWEAEDNCGNTMTGTQTITVQDTTKPILTIPANETVECDAVPALEDAIVSATDNCDADVTIEFVREDRVDGDCPNNYTLYRIWLATDNCNNSTTKTQIIEVLDRTAPTFTAPGDITIYTDADCKYDASTGVTGNASNEADNCSEGLKATYEDKVDDGQCEGEKIITRTWSLMDECGNEADDQVQIITVKDMIVPTFTAPGDITIYTDENCEYDASTGATGDVTDEADNCSTDINATYDDKVEEGLCEGEKIITRTWSLVDNCGNAAEDQIQTITVKDNIVPTFTRPIDITIYTDENCDYDASTGVTGDVSDEADNCSTDINATYLDDVKEGECQGEKIITRTWSLVDNCGNAAEDQVQTITVKDNIAPTFKAPADADLECGEDTSIANTGDVTDEADNCTSELEATYSDEVVAGNCVGNYVIYRTWSLEDSCGNKAEDQVQTITVTDTTAPVQIAPIPESMNEINACASEAPTPLTEAEFALLFEDNCSGVEVSLFSSPVGTDCGWSVIHIYTVSDGCGNLLGDFKVYYSGEDLDAPVLNDVPSDLDLACTDLIPDPATVTATDDCDPDVKVDFSERREEGNCAGNYDIIRTWSAADKCGNPVSATQTIRVRDMEAPVLTGVLPEGSNENDLCAPDTEEELVALGVLTENEFALLYTDNCSGVNVNRVINLDGDDCKWILWVRYDITDNCGNEAQSVKVWYHGADMTKPQWNEEGFSRDLLLSDFPGATCPADSYIDLEVGQELHPNGPEFDYLVYNFGFRSLLGSNATDNCTANADLIIRVLEVTNTQDSCNNLLTVTFELEDACGNIADDTLTCSFNVIDDVSPVITDAADAVAECDGTNDAFDAWLASNGGNTAEDCNAVTWTNDYNDCGQEFTNRLLTSTADFSGAEELIDFEAMPATPTGEEYAAQGVHFSNSTSFESFAYDGNGVGLSMPFVNPTEINITFDSKVNRVGFDAASADFDIDMEVICMLNGNVIATDLLTANLSYQFFGMESELGFDQIILRGTVDAETVGRFIIDNLRYEGCGSVDDRGQVNECSSSTTVTFTATDACGNESSTTSTFTVEDTTAPVFTDADCDTTVELDFDPNNGPGEKAGFTMLGEYNGHYYYLSNEAMPATAAPAHAAAAGGYMATLSDDAENSFAYNAAVASNGSNVRFWIGLTDTAVEGTFAWMDGTPLDYTNWANGEPNNAGNEDCVELGRYATAEWNDEPCTNAKLYLMEVDGITLKDKAEYTDACAGDGVSTNYSDDITFEEGQGNAGVMVFSNEYWVITLNSTGYDGNGYATYYGGIDNSPSGYYAYTLLYDMNDARWELAEYFDYGATYNYDVFTSDVNTLSPSCDINDYTFELGYGATNQLDCSGNGGNGMTNYTLVRTFTATDGCNEAECSVTYTWSEAYVVQTPAEANNEGKEDGVGTAIDTQAQANMGDDKGMELDFMAYPVPFDRDVNVKFNFEFDTDVTIDIHDTRGLLVKSLSLTNVRAGSDVKKSFDLSRAGDQLFYITVTTNQGSVTKKVVSSNMKR